MLDVERLRARFPFFQMKPDLVYFDNASTTQKPESVVQAVERYFTEGCANAGRGVYALANTVTRQIEIVRKQVQEFLGAAAASEVLFTSGATESLSWAAELCADHCLADGDEVLLCHADHRSTILPWWTQQRRLARCGVAIEIKTFGIRNHGALDEAELLAKVSPRTRVVVLTHVHNVFGSHNDIADIVKALPAGVIVVLDASQSVGHIPVNVRELGVDILCFSAHKMFAAPGTGVLWLQSTLAEQLNALLLRQEIAKDLRDLIEHRTLNFPGIAALGEAISFVKGLGVENISCHLSALTTHLLDGLRRIESIEFLPGPAYWACNCGHGILSFRLRGISAADVGFLLDQQGICLRTGNHCVEGNGLTANSVRVSMHCYNTLPEIEHLLRVLRDISFESVASAHCSVG